MKLWPWTMMLATLLGPLPALAEPPKPPSESELKRIIDQEKRTEKGEPLPLSESARAMTLPEGFTSTLFAGEPDVMQPVGFCIDHRGRLWVCENYSYPQWREKARDRILIFEDTDGDGKYDKRTVFAEDCFHYLTGIQIGNGGVWVLDAPNLLFIPVNEGQDKPAGPPVIHLDGWNWRGVHNVPNTLTWGPDGWLYGCNGITVNHWVGPPGTPEEKRVQLSCGIWRYHPTKKVFEYFAEGTTNPWGLDYNAQGQLFMSNNVVPHLWHVIQGAHYRRMHGNDINPHTYTQIQTCADHLHWGGGSWTSSRTGEIHSKAGGGHSHSGLLIYSGSAFPAEYRGTLLMANIHGRRLNNDSIEPAGSGYVARHRPDFLFANDKWFKAVAIHEGPDGAIYFLDWSDTGECHDADVTDRGHGRIYRVAYKGTVKPYIDVEKETDDRLVGMTLVGSEWYARRARLILCGRAQSGKLADSAVVLLQKSLDSSTSPIERLRAMWTLHQCSRLDNDRLMRALKDPDPNIRAWSIQLLCEDKNPADAALTQFVAMAQHDPSPVVRLYLAAAMQRTPVEKRWPVLAPLLARETDWNDANLPHMYWYALEPVVGADPAGAANKLIPAVKIPRIRELIARRITAASR